LGRIATRSISENGNPNANQTITNYDSLGRISTINNLLSSSLNSVFTYDYKIGTQQTDFGTQQLGHVYYPNGMVAQYQYFDNTGDQRLKEIEKLNNNNMISKFDYTYDAVGNIQTWTQKNSGLTAALQYQLGYDTDDQLLSATLASGSNRYYNYDSASNRTSEQFLGTASSSYTSSSYNKANQLTARTAGGPMIFTGTVSTPSIVTIGTGTATVNASGIWTGTATLSPGANRIPLQATNANNLLTTSTNISMVIASGSNETFLYDNNGNLTSESGNPQTAKTLTWDGENRLTSITYTATGNQSQFTYNGIGQMVKIVEVGTTSTTRQFIWCCGDAQPSEERDGNNNVTKRFFPQGEQILNTQTSTFNSYYYTRDHLGSVMEMTDANGVVQARYAYDPYGRLTNVPVPGATGNVASDFAYAGYYNHGPSGLYATFYRFYSPDLGRWISRDPLDNPSTRMIANIQEAQFDLNPSRLLASSLPVEILQNSNLYSYVGNNSINLFDPLGLWYVNIGIGIGGGFGLGGGFGFYIGSNGFHPYLQGGLTTPGFTVAARYSPGTVCPGWGGTIEGTFSLSVGKSTNKNGGEIGAGWPPGASAFGSYTW